jgi:hypothetical protein
MEMMQNSYDEDDGIEDSNNEPRRSPRQTTANNHQLTMAPIHCTQWNLKDGYGCQIVKTHTNRLVAAPGVQHRLVHSVPVIREPSFVHHVM